MLKIKFFVFLLFAFLVSQYSFAQLNQIHDAQGVTEDARKVMGKVAELQDEANKAFDKVIQDINRVGYNPIPLRIPFEKNPPAVNNDPYELRLNSIVMEPYGAKADLFMRIDKAKVFGGKNFVNPYIMFAANEVAFTKNGGFTGASNLIMLGDAEIEIGEGVTLKLFAINPANGSVTHAQFDCDGFKRLHLSAALEISNSVAVREDASGKKTDKPFYVEFETDVVDLNEWLFEINNIPTFQFTGLPDYSWSVKSLVYDNSLSINSPAMTIIPVDGERWKGFYCQQVSVKMPNYLRSKEKKGERSTFQVTDLQIDNSGFSGNFKVTEVFQDGAIGTWKYSVDEVSGRIVSNELKDFKMAGWISMPLAKQKTNDKGEEYSDFLYSGRYVNKQLKLDVVSVNSDWVDFTFLKAAQVTLENPGLSVTVGEKELQAAFIVDATVSIDASKSSSSEPNPASQSLLAVRLQQLKVQSQAPYLQVGTVIIDAKAKISNFPVTLVNARAVIEGDALQLGVTLNLNFMGEGENASGFGANADFMLTASRNPQTDRWSYKNMTLGQACIKVNNKAFEFNGCAQQFYEDPTKYPTPIYGEGFKAKLQAKFLGDIKVEATALFGKRPNRENLEGKKYWFVDAGVEFTKAIPIFTGVGINGFYGGAYYNMTLCGATTTTPESGTQNATSTPEGCSSQSEYGLNNNGLRFVPVEDANEVLGIRAGVGIESTPTAEAFGGRVILGAEFIKKQDKGFSIGKVSFEGKVKFINSKTEFLESKLKEISVPGATPEATTPCEEGILVDWVTFYNVEAKTLSGTLGNRINVLGIIKGKELGCGAGKTELFFSPNDWFVYVGRPDAPFGIDVLGVFSSQSYVIMGSKLPEPNFAPLPGIFTPLIDYNLLKTGGGFGFGLRAGASINIESPKIDVEICRVWGRVACGFTAGADILLAKDKSSCVINEKPRGMNGWYATGSAYVTAFAKIEGHGECVGIDGKLDLINFEIGAALAAQLPNPTLIAGQVTVTGTIATFPLSLDFKFRYPSHDQCSIGVNEANIAVIEKVYPSIKDHYINGYQGVQVSLTKGVGESFEYKIAKRDKKDEHDTYPISVLEPSILIQKVLNKEQKIYKPFTDYFIKMNTSKDEIFFVPNKVMEAGEYIATITAELSNGNNDVVEIAFTVTPEEDRIPMNLVSKSYPLPNMKNFYRLTGKQGFIQLKTLPAVPVKADPQKELVVKFIGGGEVLSTEKVTYNGTLGAENFVYNIPSHVFKESSKYRLQLVRRPLQTSTSSTTGEYTQGPVKESQADEIVLLEYDFTTSRFASFEQKMAAFAMGDGKEEGVFFILPLLLKPNSLEKTSIEAEALSEEEYRGYLIPQGERLEPLCKINSPVCPVSNQPGRTVPAIITQGSEGGNELWLCKDQDSPVSVSYYLPGRRTPEATYNFIFNKTK